jgi:hypothetical protein
MSVSFRPDIAMLRQEVRWVQINQGYAYQGHDWSSGMPRECDMVMCLSNGQKRGRRVYHVIRKSSRRLKGYTHLIEESKV